MFLAYPPQIPLRKETEQHHMEYHAVSVAVQFGARQRLEPPRE